MGYWYFLLYTFYIFEVSIKDMYFIFLKQEANGPLSTKDIDYMKLSVLTFTGIINMIISKLVHHHVLELYCIIIN